MKFFPQSFQGFLFQQASKVTGSFDDFDGEIAGISTNNAQRANERPAYSGVTFSGDTKIVNLTLTRAGISRDDLIIALDVGGTTQAQLFSTDEFGNLWYTMAKCVAVNVEGIDPNTDTQQYNLVFEVNDPAWIKYIETSETYEITETETLKTFTVPGNQWANPSFDITVGAPPEGNYLYVEYIHQYNPIAAKQLDGIDLTDGGWDTAALVADGHMADDGADVRVILDGQEYPFFVGGGGWNNAATKIWIRALWLPGRSMPLRTALDDSTTPTRIEWAINDTVKEALGFLPISGTIRVGSEEISYRNLNASRCQAVIVSREIRGTTMAAHAIGDTCWWVEHDIRIIYGNSEAVAPTYEDRYKPIFDLDTSTNSSRVYTVFADLQSLRVGSFVRQELDDGLGKLSRVYSGNNGAIAEADPATDMGMEIASYNVQGKEKPETASMAWRYFHPATISTVTTVGDKFKKYSTTEWPAFSGLESSITGKENSYVPEWNEAAPATPNVFTSITNTSAETITTGSKFIRYRQGGAINAKASNVTRLEIHGVTIDLNSSNIIQVSMSDEFENFQLTIEIRNNTTGMSLFIDYPTVQNETLYINSQEMYATFKGMNALRSLSWDDIRTNWLPFKPGPNDIEFIMTPNQTFSVLTHLYGRAL